MRLGRLLGGALQFTIVGGLVGALTAGNACTIFVDHNAHQCETTSDCAKFAGTVCGERNVCVLGETACLNNGQCVDRYGSETYFCKKDLTTDADGKPTYTKAGTCVNLLSSQCAQVLADPGDLRNDETVVVGLHLMPSWFPLLKGGVDAAELARRDFKTIAGGLPAVKGGKPRPLAFVQCDVPFGDQPKNREVTDHLLDLNVPGSIGPIIGEWMTYFLTRSYEQGKKNPVSGGPMFFTTGNKFPGFENAPGNPVFFTVGTPAEVRGRSYALLVKRFESDLRASGFTGDAKVAFISPGGPVYFVVESAFHTSARWNGDKTVEQNKSAGNYDVISWGDTSLTTDPGYVDAANKLVAFKPNIIVCDGGPLCADIPKFVETSGKVPNAYYVIGQEGQQSPLYDFVGKNENLRKRILGTHPGRHSDDPRYLKARGRFLQTFNEPAEAQGFAMAIYDLAYQMHYAIAALGDQPVTGPNIGKAIVSRFKKGGFYSPTPDAGAYITKTYQALQAGQNVEIDGATHTAVYDDTGQCLLGGQVWCIMKADALPTEPNRFADSGYYFDFDATTLKVDDKIPVNSFCF